MAEKFCGILEPGQLGTSWTNMTNGLVDADQKRFPDTYELKIPRETFSIKDPRETSSVD